jgi:cell division protein ZapA (FtsZ GTPase activity inhibitor)
MIRSDEPISFEILGERFTIKSDVPGEYFLELVGKLNAKVNEIKTKHPSLSNIKILAFAALDLADELSQKEKKSRQEDVERIAILSDTLASAIEEMQGSGRDPHSAHDTSSS